MRAPVHVVLAIALAPLAGCFGGEPATDPTAPVEPAGVDPSPAPTSASPAPRPSNATRSSANATAPAARSNSSTPATSPGAPAPVVETFLFAGNVAGPSFAARPQGGGEHAFTVRPGARLIVAELAWNATAGDLDAVVAAPGACAASKVPPDANGADCTIARQVLRESDAQWFHNDGGTPAAPDNPSRVEVASDAIAAIESCVETPCDWTAIAYYTGAVNAAYSLSVEVHYG